MRYKLPHGLVVESETQDFVFVKPVIYTGLLITDIQSLYDYSKETDQWTIFSILPSQVILKKAKEKETNE